MIPEGRCHAFASEAIEFDGALILPERVFVSEEEIKFIIKEGRATGVLEETEAALLHGVFEFADTTVEEVMIPKPKFNASIYLGADYSLWPKFKVACKREGKTASRVLLEYVKKYLDK